jgi:hypothetical protein
MAETSLFVEDLVFDYKEEAKVHKDTDKYKWFQSPIDYFHPLIVI